jgi:fermentation-respiration switch protein FrsA (DUF1100 family)
VVQRGQPFGRIQLFAALACISILLFACGSETPPAADPTAGVSPGSSPGVMLPPQFPELADDFYRLPEGVPAAEPGRLVRMEPLDAPGGVQGWRVLYHSTSVDGRDIVVSGLVFAPAGPATGPRPVVAWGHGSVGLGDSCAPSRSPGDLIGSSTLSELLRRGYVVAATDYEGLGTPGSHPWLVGRSEGRGVLDSVRAARQIPEASAGNRFLAFGASQGGGAVLFAGELAPEYAGELELMGVVAAAPAAELDLLALLPEGNLTAATGFVVMGAFGFKAAYPDLDLDAILYPDIVAQRERVERLCQEEIGSRFRSARLDRVLKANPAEADGWREAITENTPGRSRTQAPILLVHGEADQVVPVDVSRLLFDRLCGLGGVAELQTYRGADHIGVIRSAGSDVLAWIDARNAGSEVAGRPGANLCS